jgi:hypothetical protein
VMRRVYTRRPWSLALAALRLKGQWLL